MPDTVVRGVEQLTTQDQQPEDLDFTFGLGVVIRHLPNDPSNEVNNNIRAPIVKGVDSQDI